MARPVFGMTPELVAAGITSTVPERAIDSPSDPTTAAMPAGARGLNECSGHHAPIAHRFLAPGAVTVEMVPFLK